MRPNIDLSYETHGAVKDYADANNLDLTEAYETLLRAGLDNVETPTEQ